MTQANAPAHLTTPRVLDFRDITDSDSPIFLRFFSICLVAATLTRLSPNFRHLFCPAITKWMGGKERRTDNSKPTKANKATFRRVCRRTNRLTQTSYLDILTVHNKWTQSMIGLRYLPLDISLHCRQRPPIHFHHRK